MSMNTYETNGFGIFANDINITADTLRRLIALAPDVDIECRSMADTPCSLDEADLEQIQDDFLAQSEILENYAECCIDDNGHILMLAAYVAKHLDNITLSIAYDDNDAGCGNGWALLFTQCYPWSMTAEEYELTKEKLTDIFKRYLGDDASPDEITCRIYG